MKNLIIVITLLAFMGCNSAEKINGEVAISRNYVDAMAIDELFSEVEYLELEYNDEHPVGYVRKVVAEDGVLYLSANSMLFQYTLQGKFISCLSRKGRGPQEYASITDFAVCDGAIYIIDRNDKLLKFTTDNKFVCATKLPFDAATIYVEDETIILSTAYQDLGDRFRLYNAADFAPIGSFSPINPAEMTYRHFMFPQNFYRYGDKLYFHESLNNGIYEVDAKNKTFEQRYALDIYGRSAPADFWTKEYDSVMDIIQTATAKGYCCGTPIFAESRHHLLFTYNEGDNKYPMCLHDKRTGESIQFENIVIGDGLPALSVAETTFYFGDDKMQFIVIPETYFWDENGKKYNDEFLHAAKPDGNPIIAVLKL